MSSFNILGLEYKKSIVLFEINTLQFMTVFQRKTKCPNLGQKMLSLGIFWQEFENILVIFEISTLELV